MSENIDENLEDMESTKPIKKSESKDKNWKNHLLENDEEEDFDDSSFEEFSDFDESMNDDDDDDY